MQTIPITVAYGDGIGPEIMRATLNILRAAGAALDIDTVTLGEQAYLAGHSNGIAPEAWDSLLRTKVLLKGPLTTPQGSGYKSVNVTLRKSFGLYANVRSCVSYAPYIATKHPKMDVVIVRENEEDVYAGIEHRQTHEVMQCLKLITRAGCEKIIRYAFEYAQQYDRKKVSCFTKDNIMKLTDGLFHRIFNEVALEYPNIEADHWIVDIGAAMLADTPEKFDVIVMPNLYGDILSDIAAQISGSVGLGASANMGADTAMFEAVHGSAPTLAGKNSANPSGLLLSAVLMLNHLGQTQVAEKIHNAWLCTVERGFQTADIVNSETSDSCLGTEEFAAKVIANLGQKPERFPSVVYPLRSTIKVNIKNYSAEQQRLCVGVDVFVCAPPDALEALVQQLSSIEQSSLRLSVITNRGIKVWPAVRRQPFTTDHWRCRFLGEQVQHQDIVQLLDRMQQNTIDFIKTEGLYTFDGVPGFSLVQGD